MSQSLSFREIDLARDSEICVQFRAESFVESFGSAERFFRAAGEGARGYLEGLRSKNRDWPGSCVHAWLEDTIVGQVEVRRVHTTTLRVSPDNKRAVAFYRKQGWHDRGQDPEHHDVHIMERIEEPPT